MNRSGQYGESLLTTRSFAAMSCQPCSRPVDSKRGEKQPTSKRPCAGPQHEIAEKGTPEANRKVMFHADYLEMQDPLAERLTVDSVERG